MAKKFGVNRRWVQEWCQQMDKLQKLKKSFICRFGWKDFPSYYKYIHLRAIFVLEKGGRASIGYRASIGTYTVGTVGIYIQYIYKKNVMLASEPVGGRSLVTELPCLFGATKEFYVFGGSGRDFFFVYSMIYRYLKNRIVCLDMFLFVDWSAITKYLTFRGLKLQSCSHHQRTHI